MKGVGMNQPEHLYTADDVRQERRRLYEKQQGIDPILKEYVDFDKTTCDHDHATMHTRAALHRQSNSFEGRVINAYIRGMKWLTDLPLPAILRNLADYLEADYSDNPLHPGWLKAVGTLFNSLSEGQKKEVLKGLARPEGSNSKERKDIFRKALLSRQFTMTQVQNLISQVKSGTI